MPYPDFRKTPEPRVRTTESILLAVAALLSFVTCNKPAGSKEQAEPEAESASHAAKDAASDNCVGEKAALAQVAWAEKRIGEDASKQPSVLTDRRCDRWIYSNGDYRIIVRMKEGRVRARFTNFPEGRVPTAQCLEKSTQALVALVPFSEDLIRKSRPEYGSSWEDPFDGAAQWVECDEDDEVIPDKLSTLLHELNHGLDKQKCIHEPTAGEHICFDFGFWLPDGEFAALDMDKQPESIRNYETHTQTLYLNHNDVDLLQMLDELICYRIDTDVQTAIIRDRGSIFRNVGNTTSRSTHHLHLFMLYTVRYLERLKRERPAQYRDYFADGSANLANMRRLLDLCEKSRKAWNDQLAKHKEAPMEHQALLWNMYQQTKEKWLSAKLEPQNRKHEPAK